MGVIKMAKLESILISERIAIGVGGTPLYRLANEKIPEGVNVLAKLELEINIFWTPYSSFFSVNFQQSLSNT